jgi:hypothetical protein
MDQYAACFGYAVVALTVLDKLLDAARAYAASTATPKDDEIVSKAAGALDFAHQLVSFLAVAKGKKA